MRNLLAGMLIAFTVMGGALYIVNLKIEIRRLEQACPSGEADSSPPALTPPRRSLSPAEA